MDSLLHHLREPRGFFSFQAKMLTLGSPIASALQKKKFKTDVCFESKRQSLFTSSNLGGLELA